MKRKVAYGLTALAALLAAALIGAAWLAGTPEGARWLLAALSRHTPLAVSAETVEGRLLDRLRLGGLRLVLPPVEVEVGRLELAWRPLPLLSGRLAAGSLALEAVRIRDERPESPPDWAWPRLPAAALLLDGRIDRLQVKELAYSRRGEAPIRVEELSAALDWRQGTLSLTGLSLSAPQGRLSGRVVAGFGRPALEGDLSVVPASPLAGLEVLSLRGTFAPGRGDEQLAGTFSLAASTGRSRVLDLAGEAALTRKALLLRKLRLTQPGRRGELAGAGTVAVSSAGPRLALDLSVRGLDLAREIGLKTDLSGVAALRGTPGAYRGEFRLASAGRGWKAIRLEGSLAGDGSGVRFSGLAGRWLSGDLRGSLELSWGLGVSLRGAFRGRGLDPALLDADWKGRVNLDAEGEAAWPEKAPPRGRFSARFLESRLHGQALTGAVRAAFAGRELRIEELALRGRGFDIRGSGDLARRLELAAEVSDLGRLLPGTKGALSAGGWLRLREGRPEGELSGRGTALGSGGVRIGEAAFTAGLWEAGARERALKLAARLKRVSLSGVEIDSASLEAQGAVGDHRLQARLQARGAELAFAAAGACGQGLWQGRILSLSGRDTIGPWRLEAPATLVAGADRIVLSPLVLRGEQAETCEIAGDWGPGGGGSFRVLGKGINLVRANPWLPRELDLEGRLTGRAEGRILEGQGVDLSAAAALSRGKLRWQRGGGSLAANVRTAELSGSWRGPLRPGAGAPPGKLALSARVEADGVLTLDERPLAVDRGILTLEAGEGGTRAGLDLTLAGGGEVQGGFSSPAPPAALEPETGGLTARWSGIDLALLRPWLPAELLLEGKLSGRAAGQLLAGRRLDLAGDASLAGARVRRVSPEGEMNLDLSLARLAWTWRNGALDGDLSLALAERGEARGRFRLPLPARLPTALERRGPLRAGLSGKVRENGLLGALLPGLVRESRGEVAFDLTAEGTPAEPVVGGSLKLSGAGAYLPTAGIRLRDVGLEATLEKDAIRVTAFRAESGAGHLAGTALVRLKAWQVADFRGSLGGERFQAVNLPELQILATPRLTFEGTPGKLTLRGEVELPEALVTGPPARDYVTASRDVVLEGAAKPAERTLPLALDARVRLLLGPKVLVKLAGIDARLGGAVDLEFRDLERIAGRGEIRAEKGRYKAYGVDLEILRGRLIFAGGPVDRPTLDLLALRAVDGVKAGVTAGGVLNAPVVKLYAEPAMADADILSYILFGHGLSRSSDRTQAGMMAQAAGVLLSRGQSVVLQEQIKKRLGLSTLELQSGSAAAASRMGYKEIQAAPAGVSPSGQAAGLAETMLTVGKYLTPKLYFSYGRSLFTGANLFRLRYDLFRQWQIETQTGSESGVDLYYRIDFQ